MAKKKQTPKTKFEKMKSERDSLLDRPRQINSLINTSRFLAAPFGKESEAYLRKDAKQDSVRGASMTPQIRKELTNIKPTKPVIKSVSDKTKVSKPTVAKKIVKSQILVKKKK